MSVSIKHLRSAQSSRLHKLGASGSLKLARKGEHAPRKYASGGGVDASPVDGAPAKSRLDRPGRKMAGKGKDKKGGTNVNVIVMPKGGDGPGAPPPMPMPPPGAGPGGPPPGPPGPPMPPMRKHGGAVGRYATGGRISNLGKYAHGGKVRKGKADGGEAVEKRVRGPGELDEGAQRDYVKSKAKNEEAITNAAATSGIAATGIGSGIALAAKRKSIPAAIAAGGVNLLGLAANRNRREQELKNEAKAFDKADREEAGQRKRGGSVKKSKC